MRLRTNHDSFIKETDDTRFIRDREKVLLLQRFFGFDTSTKLFKYREMSRKFVKLPMGILRPFTKR